MNAWTHALLWSLMALCFAFIAGNIVGIVACSLGVLLNLGHLVPGGADEDKPA